MNRREFITGTAAAIAAVSLPAVQATSAAATSLEDAFAILCRCDPGLPDPQKIGDEIAKHMFSGQIGRYENVRFVVSPDKYWPWKRAHASWRRAGKPGSDDPKSIWDRFIDTRSVQ